tara:strand:+ start:11612 stop:11917 length:306 start_codon:yes stop_codon:yes gene_type:complete
MFLRFFQQKPETYREILFYHIKISIILIFYALIFLVYAFFQKFRRPKKLTVKYLCICLRIISINNGKGEEQDGVEFKRDRFKTTGEILDKLYAIREKRKKG